MDYGGKGKVWLGERQEQIMIERQGGAEKGGGLNEESGVRKHRVRCGGMLEACMVCSGLTRFNLSVDCKL